MRLEASRAPRCAREHAPPIRRRDARADQEYKAKGEERAVVEHLAGHLVVVAVRLETTTVPRCGEGV